MMWVTWYPVNGDTCVLLLLIIFVLFSGKTREHPSIEVAVSWCIACKLINMWDLTNLFSRNVYIEICFTVGSMNNTKFTLK